jgi:hypothetical protein
MGLQIYEGEDGTEFRNPSAIREDIRRLSDGGVTRLAVNFQSPNPYDLVRQIMWFGDVVVGELR